MKGFGKLLVVFSLTTAALLLYVHERVEMLRVSYRIYEKSSRLAEKSEEFRRLKFEVSQLRSPQMLERRLEELSLGLTLPQEIKVLKVHNTSAALPVETLPLPPVHSRSFLDFVGQWIQTAQARTEQ